MTQMVFEIMRLSRKHNRNDFHCGETALDEYLRIYARQDVRRDMCNVFVAVTPGSSDVIGFYSLSNGAVQLTDVPPELRKKLPGYEQIPAMLLGRLAVCESMQGQRLGAYLLQDALQRSLESSGGWKFFIVQAKHDRAAAFYRHFEFQPFCHDPMALFITRKTAITVCEHND